MDKSKETSLVAACKDFFGFLPGSGLRDFMEEFKALTPEDKAEIKAGLEQNGYHIKAD